MKPLYQIAVLQARKNSASRVGSAVSFNTVLHLNSIRTESSSLIANGGKALPPLNRGGAAVGGGGVAHQADRGKPLSQLR